MSADLNCEVVFEHLLVERAEPWKGYVLSYNEFIPNVNSKNNIFPLFSLKFIFEMGSLLNVSANYSLLLLRFMNIVVVW